MTMSEQVAPGKRAFAVEARFVVILTIFECSLLFKCELHSGAGCTPPTYNAQPQPVCATERSYHNDVAGLANILVLPGCQSSL